MDTVNGTGRVTVPTRTLLDSPSFCEGTRAAVIAQGIHRRFVDGDTLGGGCVHVDEAVEPLAAAGLARIAM
jgi:hypothetical protein